MSLEFASGVFTAPTTNGNDTVISPGFAPKAIILWTTAQTAAGAIDGHGIFTQGMATYDGGTVQEFYMSLFDTDALGTSSVARGSGTGSLLKGFSAATPTVDFECDLVSMDATSVTIDWADAPASAIIVHYIILGGSDITGARVGVFNLATTSPQSVTVNAGFGQPDLLFFLSKANIGATGDANASGGIEFGVAASDTDRICSMFMDAQGSTTMAIGSWQKARAHVGVSGNTADFEMDLDARANYPTDGFQVTIPDLPAAATNPIGYLALKGTFQWKIGVNTAPTAGGLPVVQDNACGFPPKGAMTFGNNIGSISTYDISNADLGAHFMGATDGTNEGLSAVTQDDANTTSFAGRVHSITKTVAFYKFGTLGTDPPALQSEADGSFSGNNFRLSWNDIDSVAREYCYVVLGDAPAAGTTYNKNGSLVAGSSLLGADASTFIEAGSVVADSLLAGADVSEHSETGTIRPQAQLSGADAATLNRAGSLAAAARLSGAAVFIASETGSISTGARLNGTSLKEVAPHTGSLVATGRLSGADVSEYVETGAVITDTNLSGADVGEHAEAGSLIVDTLLVGADVTEHAEAGTLQTQAQMSGVAAFIASETGTISTAARLSGTSLKQSAGKTGTVQAGGLLSGTDVHEAVRTGSVQTRSSLSGMSQHERQRQAVLTLGALLAGADATQHSETGSLVASAQMSGADAATFSETGLLRSQLQLSGSSFLELPGKKGDLVTATRLSGADTSEHSESGLIVSTGQLRGADVAILVRTGSLIAGTQLRGADSFQPSKRGSIVAGTKLSGSYTRVFGRTGFLATGARLSGFNTVTNPKVPGTEVLLVNADGSPGGLLGRSSGGSLIGQGGSGELHTVKG